MGTLDDARKRLRYLLRAVIFLLERRQGDFSNETTTWDEESRSRQFQSLEETMRDFETEVLKVDSNPGLVPLIVQVRQAVETFHHNRQTSQNQPDWSQAGVDLILATRNEIEIILTNDQFWPP